MVPYGPLLRHSAIPAHPWQGEEAGPHPKPGSLSASWAPISSCGRGSGSVEGAPGLHPAHPRALVTLAQPVPPASEHGAALTLLVLRSPKQVPALQRLGAGGGGLPRSFVYFPSVSASLFPPCPQEGML